MGVYLSADIREHKVITEKIIDADGKILYRISSAYRFESESGGLTYLTGLVPGLGQLVEEDETKAWQSAIILIDQWYVQQRTSSQE